MNARTIEVESLEQLRGLLATEPDSLTGWHLQSLDVRGQSFHGRDVSGAVFLGCRFDDGAEADLRSRGALIFPVIPGVPFDAYRNSLYSGAELFRGLADGYEHTLDGQIYQWTLTAGATGLANGLSGRSLDATLAMAMHDHAIGDALEDLFDDVVRMPAGKLVGVMGGHGSPRGSAGYRVAADLGRRLSLAGFTVATGGGPGSMEAANLGAWLAAEPVAALEWALARLAEAPDFRPSVARWAQAGLDVVERYPEGVANIGIPTWFYGHEPPNVFASAIAKYFANSIREAVLLACCTGGIIFSPGAAGTVQEIFQDGCENYYAAAAAVTPMVLLDTEYWTTNLPVWPLLQRLAQDRPMQDTLLLTDDPAEAVEFLKLKSL